MLPEQLLNILLVEDNPGDVRLFREFLKEFRIEHQLTTKLDGDEAIKYLSQIKNKPIKPNLIFLDINLPKKSGFEVLEFIKSEKKLAAIPAVFLSSSNDPYDRKQSIIKGATSYMEKPMDLKGFFDVLKKIENFTVTVKIGI